MPDVVDGLTGIARGHFGQGIGHSLIGMLVLGLPLGLVLRYWLCKTARHCISLDGRGFVVFLWNHGRRALADGATDKIWPRRRIKLLLISLSVGITSHLLFDLVSHGHIPWFIPWTGKIPIFPEFWHAEWFRIPRPWRASGRKVGPHAAIWVLLSAIGIWMLAAPLYRKWKEQKCASPRKVQKAG
jgi:membrane-bound metal-dependent hydrolase YbcI (DUF457 family)